MKKIIIIMMGILLLINMINLVEAKIEYNQFKLINRNPTVNISDKLTNTTTIFATIDFTKTSDNFVKGNRPLEFFVQFDITIDTWNNVNPDFSVDTCNFTARTFPEGLNTTPFIFNRIYTEDNINDKHFVRLEEGDFFTVAIDCHFNGQNTSLKIPANLQIVTPTFECKACQFFEWTLIERDIDKAESIGDKVVVVSDLMRKLVLLNFEILITLFWILLIIIAVHSTGLIFVGLIWMFAYLKNLIK